jgi:plasmid replication initiation protein
MSKNRQLDLFVALIGDVPFRDEREAMSAPLVALSKNKRTRIEWGPIETKRTFRRSIFGQA